MIEERREKNWNRKSRRWQGRPEVTAEIRALIRQVSQANPLWGAPRIHGELLKLGIEVAEHAPAADATLRPIGRIGAIQLGTEVAASR